MPSAQQPPRGASLHVLLDTRARIETPEGIILVLAGRGLHAPH
jgi:hypothetical protein